MCCCGHAEVGAGGVWGDDLCRRGRGASPSGAVESSPGREPWGFGAALFAKPRRGGRTNDLSPLRGSVQQILSLSQG